MVQSLNSFRSMLYDMTNSALSVLYATAGFRNLIQGREDNEKHTPSMSVNSYNESDL